MAVTYRWLLRLFLALSFLVSAGLGLAYYLAAGSLPNYNADYRVTGLSGTVEIVRDAHNVPHIFAGSDSDIYYGLGLAHAQDRLWQMTLLRRIAQGRLSELFGKRTLPTDEMMRRLDIYNLSQTSFDYQTPNARSALSAYANGVNAWMKIVQTQALGRGAPEFFRFSKSIAPWRPVDSLAILRLMALRQSDQIAQEVLRARTSLLVSNERLGDILPDAPGPGAIALPAYGTLFPELPVFANAKPEGFLNPIPQRGFAGASNALAAASLRTATNSTLLANDPHVPLSAPSLWMLARLDLSTGGIIGATIPGMPLILAGRSDRIGWGITASYLDDQDILIEKLNPNDPGSYLTETGGYKPFRTRSTVISVKESPDVAATLRWSRNGPILPGNLFDLATITPTGHVAALSWVGLSAEDTSMSAMFDIMTSQSVQQGIEAGKTYTAPSQNLLLADKDTVGFQLIGKMPNRRPTHNSQGRIPSAGWAAENLWDGFLPYENNPRTVSPSSGLLANTNNKTVDRPFPNHVSFNWGDTQRIERLQKLLRGRRVHSRESFIEAQLDEVSFSARSLLPLIARDLWFTGDTAPVGSKDRTRKLALNLLADWNGEMNEHLPEPLIFSAWLRQLQKNLAQDELGPLISEYRHTDPVFIERVYRDIDGASVWCDIVQSGARETCAEIARAALDHALFDLSEKYGTRLTSWRWGDAHQAQQDHEVFGKIPLLGWLVNIRQSTSGGDNTLLRGRTGGEEIDPFANVHAAGYRGVYDFADPDSSVFIISTGQSGHPLSRHYDDLAQLWRRGEYIPMSLDPDLARAAAVGVTKLIPEE